MTEQQIVFLRSALERAGIAFRRGEALSAHTSFRIGGPAAVFAMPASSGQLAECLRLCREADVRLPGGTLHIRWLPDGQMEMRGPAENVFSGEFPT